MGMRGHVRSITPSQLKEFQRNPKTVHTAVHGKAKANAAKIKDALARAQEIAMKARASGRMGDPAEQEKARALILKELQGGGINLQGGSDENGLNLEKSWHVLHYLLTGKAEEAPPPLGNAILGGTEIGGDLGYGPARFLTALQVREVAAALASISADDLAKRFNLEAMISAQIYPVRDEGELELAQDYFQQLSHYYADAAAAGNAMLLYVI
jgi:hypothetical protein